MNANETLIALFNKPPLYTPIFQSLSRARHRAHRIQHVCQSWISHDRACWTNFDRLAISISRFWQSAVEDVLLIADIVGWTLCTHVVSVCTCQCKSDSTNHSIARTVRLSNEKHYFS